MFKLLNGECNVTPLVVLGSAVSQSEAGLRLLLSSWQTAGLTAEAPHLHNTTAATGIESTASGGEVACPETTCLLLLQVLRREIRLQRKGVVLERPIDRGIGREPRGATARRLLLAEHERRMAGKWVAAAKGKSDLLFPANGEHHTLTSRLTPHASRLTGPRGQRPPFRPSRDIASRRGLRRGRALDKRNPEAGLVLENPSRRSTALVHAPT